MTKQEAKEILMLYRPGTADQDDPDFAPALELTKSDPELLRWLEEHCAFQKAVRAKFEEIIVPDGLKEQILSERKAHATLGGQRKAVLFAMAAAVILALFGLARFYQAPRENNSLPVFRAGMASMVLRTYPQMDLETNDLTQIRQYLAQHRGHADYTMPKALAQTSPTGCKIFPWHGKTVSMVCFNSGTNASPNTPDLFLFVIDRAAISNPPDASQFARISALTTATWSSGDKTYVLGGLGGEEFLRKYL